IQLSDILQEGGYRMQIARNGIEAIQQIGQFLPDAMILDLMMPGMDGFEVLKTLRDEERTAHVPVLILTAKHITKEELRFLKRNNIHQLVQKGDINRKDLMKAIEDMAFKVVKAPDVPIQIRKSKPTILIVEDNPDNMLTAKALLSDDYEVLEAIDGNEALQMTKLYLPDLILMDIELPGVDGVEAFRIIRNDVRLQKIPIVALTASAMTSDREAILAYGFDGYIAKPIDDILFSETIKNILYG
ncbi:MAG: response regulator, partial [Bacteroidia bacterium]|nr:response regulator [Bacteroidia bacterium]